MKTGQTNQDALRRATANQSTANYAAIFTGFSAKGIPDEEILPRENIFTYAAWKALGRQVRKGEHGVKVVAFVDMTKTDPETGDKTPIGRKPRRTTVFHVSQTDIS